MAWDKIVNEDECFAICQPDFENNQNNKNNNVERITTRDTSCGVLTGASCNYCINTNDWSTFTQAIANAVSGSSICLSVNLTRPTASSQIIVTGKTLYFKGAASFSYNTFISGSGTPGSFRFIQASSSASLHFEKLTFYQIQAMSVDGVVVYLQTTSSATFER